MTRLLSIIFFTCIFNNVIAQNSIEKQITVKQIGKHLENNYLHLKRSSKKVYFYNQDGLISKVISHKRHHYAYLRVIGEITNYNYQNEIVIEIDTTYCCEDDNIINVTTDTLNRKSFTKIPSFDSENFILDLNKRLIESKSNKRTKKYHYSKNGLLKKIAFHYSDSLDKQSKYYNINYKWTNIKGLSTDAVIRLNTFLIWQHGYGI